MFERLYNEVEVIRNSWGYDFLDALDYIRTHREEYRGTAVMREFNEFMRQAAELLAPVDQSA